MQLDEGEMIRTVEEEVAISKLEGGEPPCIRSAEMLKGGRMVVVKWLHKIMRFAWDNGQVTEDS